MTWAHMTPSKSIASTQETLRLDPNVLAHLMADTLGISNNLVHL